MYISPTLGMKLPGLRKLKPLPLPLLAPPPMCTVEALLSSGTLLPSPGRCQGWSLVSTNMVLRSNAVGEAVLLFVHTLTPACVSVVHNEILHGWS